MAENKILPPEEPETGGKHRITISNTLLIALSLVLVCAVAWAWFMGFMVGRGQNPGADIASITGLVPDEPATPATSAVAEAPLVHNPPVGETAKAWPENPAPRPAPKPATPKPAPPNPKPAKPVQSAPLQPWNYTFQVAALKNPNDVAELQKTLKEKGIRATARKSGKVTLLVVNLRGTREDVEKLSAKLKSARLGKPLQLSRTPVLPPAKKQK